MKFIKLQLYILFITVFSTSFYAQEKKDSLKIPFISYWSKGDVYKFKVKKYAVLSDSKDLKYPSDHLPVYVEISYK